MSRAGTRGIAPTLALAALAAGALLCAPGRAQAQDRVYGPGEVTSPPKPTNMARVVRLINDSYPPNMRDSGLGGSVQVQFVVDADGRVDKESVQVLAATAPALAKAGRDVAQEIDFIPAQKDGTAVRCKVVLPITYRPQ